MTSAPDALFSRVARIGGYRGASFLKTCAIERCIGDILALILSGTVDGEVILRRTIFPLSRRKKRACKTFSSRCFRRSRRAPRPPHYVEGWIINWSTGLAGRHARGRITRWTKTRKGNDRPRLHDARPRGVEEKRSATRTGFNYCLRGVADEFITMCWKTLAERGSRR